VRLIAEVGGLEDTKSTKWVPLFEPRSPKRRPKFYKRDSRAFWYVDVDGNTFLDQFQLQPGDVLLTRTAHKYSRVIARAQRVLSHMPP
jgi:hypothetical protein